MRKILGTFLRTIASPKLAGGGQGGVEIRRGIEVVGGPCRRFLFFFSSLRLDGSCPGGVRSTWGMGVKGSRAPSFDRALFHPNSRRVSSDVAGMLPRCHWGVSLPRLGA